MSRFVLVPGAGGSAWYWHRVVAELRTRGHEAVAVDLPGADPSAGLPEYADTVASAVGGHPGVVLVAQSMGGFTAPMVCARTPVDVLVLLNAMIPLPGETPGQWWGDTGSEPARLAAAAAGGYTAEVDLDVYFLHDVPADVAAAGADHQGPEAEIAFGQPCAIREWPEVTTHVLAAAEDRFFPLEFQRRVAHERLGIEAETVPGGHLAALSHPVALVDRLIAYAPSKAGPSAPSPL
ncbi:alpha/beta fold hydrolase [Streptomyces sp. NPDC002580]|uniref:alpha/beta fold hydrolase n=1 Tax=Streptomyces sp. NPDC002580 TaxID=3364653 RepID=UPI0036CE00F1